MEISKKTSSALFIIILVYFFWGFAAASNTILIPVFKENFNLTQAQSQLVDFAFYIAYAVGSLIYFVWSFKFGDPLNKIGYKKGLILGLCISALGTLLFIPASMFKMYELFLLGLFVIAFGFSLQQIVANPYVLAMGTPQTGAHRVSLAGAINSLGTTIGPLIIGKALFGNINGNKSILQINDIQTPYLILGVAFIAFAVLLYFAKLPTLKTEVQIKQSFGVFKFPNLVLGIFAIFFYVGAEVTVQSNLPALIQNANFLGLGKEQSVHFISLYWGSLMIGRWAGASSAFNITKKTRLILNFILPALAFLVIIGVNYISNKPYLDIVKFWPFVVLAMVSFVIANEKPAFTIQFFSIISIILLLVGMNTTGAIAVYSFIAVGLFCSVLWPCIFSLALAGLKEFTAQGSSLLIMMIAGGAFLPVIQGFLTDVPSIGVQLSYIVPLIAFAYLAFFGWRVKHILAKNEIDFDSSFVKK